MVFVTGATGILGRVIVLELLKRGKNVRASKRKNSNLEDVQHSYRFYTENPDEIFSKIEWVDVDFDDIQSLQNALKDVEEIYHCAAKVSFHPNSRKEIYHTNINGTKNLLYACENSLVKKFCFISSIAVLDGFNENGETDEDSNYNPKLNHSSYSVSKHFSEMEVWRASAEGLQTVIVNPGIIIGSGNWGKSSGTLFPAIQKSSFTFSGGSAYVDVRDVAEITIDLMEKNIFGERFILISENKKFLETGNLIREKLDLKKLKILPKWVLNVGRILNIFFGWLFPILKMANKTNIETITSDTKITNKKIRERLDYHFTPVSESIDFHLKNYIEDTRNKAKETSGNTKY